MAAILCKNADDFSRTCLRKYMRGFSYFGDSLDMAVRKMLMAVELPKETQQIDRLLVSFADRYYECNPGIFASADEANFVAFSILLLHSDTHNKNNKRKMQKHDYMKNTRQGPIHVAGDILECFYDNICYTPFIHFEDEVALNSHRLSVPKVKKGIMRTRSSENVRGPVDPYTLILDNKLELLRPSLKDVMDTEDTYNSTGTQQPPHPNELHRAFSKSSVLQIVSARSRPDAFSTQATISNPSEAQAGLVSIKIAKVGLLWRKDPRRKRAKSPWQEWGAILTDSKLYFFKDLGWVRKLCGQYEAYAKLPVQNHPLIFKPPVSAFEPDALISMDDAVALMDSSYKKHKNAFTFIKHGGFEEVFLANSEGEMNDWIAKLNYAATFRTAGVRMRGQLGTNYEGRQITRKDSELSTKSVTETRPVETPPSKRPDPQMAWEIMFYRRQIISERISDLDERAAAATKELENLLRNARHLLILLPIQAKTREALVLAAGRMSAKLKWTRVEVWRTKTHKDILVKDLEQESVSEFPQHVGKGTPLVTPAKPTPLRIGQPNTNRVDADLTKPSLSPTSLASSASRRPSQGMLEKINIPERIVPVSPVSPSHRKSASIVDISSVYGNPSVVEEHYVGKRESNSDSHSLAHQASVVSSHRSRTDPERHATTADDPEDQDKRPDTSESDRDRIGAISPDSISRDLGGSIRRSLHRTLRDPHLHHTPSHHRGKKGRESGSSITATEDGRQSTSVDSEELRRGTGSFILHGKKASVITMSSEWESLSNEERLRLRKSGQEQDLKGKARALDEEEAIEDGTASVMSGPSTYSLVTERRDSMSTTKDEHFEDAEDGRERDEEMRKEGSV